MLETMASKATHVILFYKYHPLSEVESETELYRAALEDLCTALELSGRILVGCARNEGINGTLAGEYNNVRAFTLALLKDSLTMDDELSDTARNAVERYWTNSREFFEKIREPMLKMNSPHEFKWSKCETDETLFPDLNIKLVSELIGSGGAMKTISIDETSKGYLEPREWHEELKSANKSDDTVIIDCRNTKEYDIGHFEGSVDPETTTYAQFPKWVKDNEHKLSGRKVLMYCTGGIRCEKASAYLRREVQGVKSVSHLRGGIHKYLEEFGESQSLWKGRNFVFDKRQAASAEETRQGRDPSLSKGLDATSDAHADSADIVGRCLECDKPYDSYDARCVCTVCREPTLVCFDCQQSRRIPEYHCKYHFYLRECYFTNLGLFNEEELQQQLEKLEDIYTSMAVGKKFKQKRKTILKQLERITCRMQEPSESVDDRKPYLCRNCGESECSGKCWGFFGLKRKRVLEEACSNSENHHSQKMVDSELIQQLQQRLSKQVKRSGKEKARLEWIRASPAQFRDVTTQLRIPPSCTRVLSCNTKAKWRGDTVSNVIRDEFPELSKPETLRTVLEAGLLRMNGSPVSKDEITTIRLKDADTIERIVHWHEPPVLVPQIIGVERMRIPSCFVEGECEFFVCNKPSSVPVHAAGPFLSNTLVAMVEAQENLASNSLHPLHRIDRVTSGLVLCSNDHRVSKLLNRCISSRDVEKLYLAQVKGSFPSSLEALASAGSSDEVKVSQPSCEGGILFDAPVKTIDAAFGIRQILSDGKPAKTVFKLLSYDNGSNTSVVACSPITGRNHQIRVHLRALGFPIVGDSLYGGDDLKSIEKGTVLSAMERVRDEPDYEIPKSILSSADIAAARTACNICSGKSIDDSFTSSQLLQGGHAIRLHALRYRLKLATKEEEHFLDVRVDAPEWYSRDIDIEFLKE